jgi:arsenical pump membrane protein
VSSALAVLAVGVVATVVPLRRAPTALVVGAIAVLALVVGLVPTSAFGDALDALAAPLAFLLVAVPLAVLLDRVGFFAAVAALVDGGRHLRPALWLLAAAVTVLFNLDAAVVLLTPLYVRIALRHDDDPIALAFIPALMASLASSVLPVSNLTNLVVVERVDVGTADFLRHAAPSSVAAIAVGWFAYRVMFPAPAARTGAARSTVVDRRALRIGVPVVVWLLVGFTVGERFGAPAWLVAAVALVALVAVTREVPWRAVPVAPALLALGLGTLAIAAAPGLHLERVVELDGRSGDAAVFGVAVAGANVMNNLPATVVALPSLDLHPDRAWALLLGVNLGPLLWLTGALSTLLWQSTLGRLGHPIGARRYATVGWRVGVPAIVVALAVRLVVA